MAPTSGRAGRSTAFVAGAIAAIIGAAGCGGGSKPGSGTQFIDDKARVDVCVLTGATTNAGCDLGTGGGAEVKVGDLTMGQVKTRDVAVYNGGAGNVTATIQAVTVDAGPNTAANYQIAKIFRLDTANNEVAVTLPFDLAVSHGNELRVRVSYAAHDPIGPVAGASVKVVASHPSATTSIPITGNITGCPAGRGDCDGNPANDCEVDLQTDMAHCGACATSCGTGNAAGTTCAAGTCNIVCDAGFGNCDGNSANGCETNLLADPLHCNACGGACDTTHGTASCNVGVCGITCNVGFADCDGNAANGCEVDLSTDAAHCGACATACDATNGTATCTGGVCGISCNTNFANCDGNVSNGCEVNLQTDLTHCGACATACSTANGTASCNAGTCAIACAAGFADCDGNVANGCESNLNTDVRHCGTCATSCNGTNGTPSCTSGVCQIACAAGFGNCNNTPVDGCEVNLNTDPQNCSACGLVCNSTNGTATCSGGACGINCNAGFGNCDGLAANGCEVNLSNSVANCGACGSACGTANGTASCTASVCAIACNPGWANCNGQNADGCEVHTDLDPANCGACGAACSLPGAVAGCAAGSCVVASCNTGRADCNGVPTDGCEIDTTRDVNNCGACGHACSVANGTPACVNSQCVIASCNPGFADCNGLPGDGCEINLNADPSNCAACGAACNLPNATPACTSGTCTVAACAAGFGDCDLVSANGCEVNLTTDVTHCGTCATACSTNNGTPSCTAGACGITCAAGFGNCDSLASNGCEANLNTDVTHCGACATVCNSTNGTANCTAGACGITCNAPFANCDGSVANGCEVNLNANLANCGACGNVCGSANTIATSCTGGVCGLACAPGYADCNLVNADGCETNLLLSPANCGACGAVCALPGAVAGCAAGGCVVASCLPGRLDLNGLPGDGCEVDTTSDPNNCGGAGIVCTAPNGTPACVNSQCVIAACNPGFADCNGLPGDGCEIDLNADPSNCAACGNVCTLPNTATAACTAGSCTVAACVAGFGNCNLAAADGCEVNTTNDASNCGACGTVCANGPNVTAEACVSSACKVTACAAGFYDANGSVADGCECQADSNSSSCAAPTNLGALSPGQTRTVSGQLIPVGKQEYLQITFTGNTSTTFHPRIRLTSNPTGVVRFDVVSSCSGPTLGCGDGGVSTSRTDWETFYTAGDPASAFVPITPPGGGGTVIIRVFAAGTVPACIGYTLTISD